MTVTSAPPYVPGHGLLVDKTVVVTAAAGTGIGSAVARRAIEEGASVLISDFHERRLGEPADRLAEETGTPFIVLVAGKSGDLNAPTARRKRRAKRSK